MALNSPRIHLSGGQLNQAASMSLGGAVSLSVSAGIGSQKLVWTTTSMSGMTLCEGHNVALGAGVLSYDPGTGVVEFTDFATSLYVVQLGSDGLYQVGSAGNYFIIYVITSLLPTAGYTERDVTVLAFKNAAYDDVLNNERSSGRTEYRCFYLRNESTTVDLLNPRIAVADPTLGYIEIAKEYVYSGASGVMTPQGLYKSLWQGTLVPTFMTAEYKNAAQPEALNHARMLPIPWAVNYEGPSREQDSDGFTTDVSPLTGDEIDTLGMARGLNFVDELAWSRVRPRRYVSFWMRREIPYGTTGALINDVSALTFTYTP